MGGATRLADVDRIRTLLTMLEWHEGAEKWLKATSYMEVEAGPDKLNEYKERPVLPDPMAVAVSASTLSSSRPNKEGVLSMSTAKSGDTTSNPTPTSRAAKTGTITKWVTDRGYGFIKPDDGSADLFVHQSDVQGNALLQPGQKVKFEVSQGAKGLQARKVQSLP